MDAETLSMARSLGQMIGFGALAALIAIASSMPRAVAVEEMRQFNKDDGKKAGNTKSCPSGQRYSEKKRGCIRTSCGTGQVWSLEACLNGNSASLTDDDLYVAGRELGQEAHYAEALNLFFRIKNREQARVLSSISYSTRKLGDVDNSIDYYHQALAIDPNYTKARQSRRNLSAEGRRGEGERAADGDRRPLRRSLRRL